MEKERPTAPHSHRKYNEVSSCRTAGLNVSLMLVPCNRPIDINWGLPDTLDKIANGGLLLDVDSANIKAVLIPVIFKNMISGSSSVTVYDIFRG